jgi:hypothetical protein
MAERGIAQHEGRIVGVLNAVEWPNCQLRMSEKLRVAPSMIRVTGLGLPSAFRMTNVWARHDPAEPGPPLPPAARGGA